jgi:hypothetical protein
MSSNTGIKGLDKVVNNINKELLKIEGDLTSKGFAKVVSTLFLVMDGKAPMIPVKFGIMRDSFFPSLEELAGMKLSRRKQHTLVFGFEANYSAAVHEKNDALTNWSRPGSGAKFLELHLKAESDNILKILARYAKIKGKGKK